MVVAMTIIFILFLRGQVSAVDRNHVQTTEFYTINYNRNIYSAKKIERMETKKNHFKGKTNDIISK